jgi:hypothetical protein
MRVVFVCCVCLATSALLPAAAWAPWGTGAMGPPAFKDEQVCRNGVTWRYVHIEAGGADLLRPNAVATAAGEPVPLAGPVDMRVPAQPTYVDASEINDAGFFWITGYPGVLTHSVVQTLQFKRVVSPNTDINVTWDEPGFVGPNSGFAFPTWTARKCHLIDLEPGEFPNEVHPRSLDVEVAVLTTHGFKAKRIKRASLRFGTNGFRASADRSKLVDVDRDDDRDLLVSFRTAHTGIDCASSSAKLRARLHDGTKISGTDSVLPVGC